MPGEGPAGAKIMLVGQAPGVLEDRAGKPFVGRAGRFLGSLLDAHSIDRSRCFITSVVKCYPPGNRIPRGGEIQACHGYLVGQIQALAPEVIVALGNVARKEIELIGPKCKVIYTYHPAAGMRFPHIAKQMRKDFESLRSF